VKEQLLSAKADSIAPARLAPGWRPALCLIAAAALALGLVFRRDAAGAVQVWLESTAYNHCFLVPVLIGWLLWERRAVFAAVSPRPVLWPLPLLPLLSGVWLVAAVLDLQEGRQLAAVAMLEVVLLVALGPQVVRLLLAPLLFLFFLVPSGAFLVPWLQRVTADISVAGLHLLNIPVYSDGLMIEVPEGTFEIAEACAGLRFLIASIVFGCFFAVVMYRSWARRTLFIALSVAVPIGANGLRALGIILLAHIEGSAAAVEADHVLYGWLFFSLVILMLIAIGMTFVDKGGPSPLPAQAAALRQPSSWRLVVAVAAAVVLAVSGPAYAIRLDSLFPASQLAAAESPAVAPPWRALPEKPDWRPSIEGADRQFLEGFAEPGSDAVIRYVGLYRLRAVGNTLTRSENRVVDDRSWRLAQRGRAELSLDGQKANVAAAEIVSGPRRRLVWSFYVVDGRIVGGLIEAKLLQARAVLLRQADTAAFVAVSASMDDPDDPAPAQLQRFLAANEPLAGYLDRLAATARGGA
jgi:exosortase A